MSVPLRGFAAVATGVVLGMALSVGSGVFAQKESDSESLPWDEARLLAEVLERVRKEYVEPVDDSELMEAAVRGMITDLDPHSQFLDSDEFEEIRISTRGNYSGVGLEVEIRGGDVRVIAPIEGTPAQRAGIRSGDVLISIDGVPVDDGNVSDAIARMRGEAGTEVRIALLRGPADEALDFTLVRERVVVKSVRFAMLEPGLAYLRITQFSETTYKDMRRALASLRRETDQELEGLILDLRDNPGGVLEAAVDVADAFLDEGIIVTAEGRGPGSTFRHEAVDGDLMDGADIVVMVNAGSASASEIVAGALQDHDRAAIVGSQTFGKGSVQTVMPLSSGRAIKLTTSRYYTPSGTTIHGEGITPDITLIADEKANRTAGIGSHQRDDTAALLQTDSQLRRALVVLKGERVLASKAL